MRDDLVHTAVHSDRGSGQKGESRPEGGEPAKTVLLAEDNEDDILLMKMACERSGIPNVLQVVKDGAMAIDYLSETGPYADRTVYPMPNIVFLDINMPRQNGFEVLKLIRAKPALKKLPVVMLSNSTLMADVDRAYLLGVTSYLLKSANQPEFEQAVRVILKSWLEMGETAS
jgi:CheY-like chemotaxis protein